MNDKIIEILATLIKEAEERECNCRGGGSGKSQKQGQAGESQSQASRVPETTVPAAYPVEIHEFHSLKNLAAYLRIIRSQCRATILADQQVISH